MALAALANGPETDDADTAATLGGGDGGDGFTRALINRYPDKSDR
jgi:hypothetical protein